jgi:hypothetical protein
MILNGVQELDAVSNFTIEIYPIYKTIKTLGNNYIGIKKYDNPVIAVDVRARIYDKTESFLYEDGGFTITYQDQGERLFGDLVNYNEDITIRIVRSSVDRIDLKRWEFSGVFILESYAISAVSGAFPTCYPTEYKAIRALQSVHSMGADGVPEQIEYTSVNNGLHSIALDLTVLESAKLQKQLLSSYEITLPTAWLDLYPFLGYSGSAILMQMSEYRYSDMRCKLNVTLELKN